MKKMPLWIIPTLFLPFISGCETVAKNMGEVLDDPLSAKIQERAFLCGGKLESLRGLVLKGEFLEEKAAIKAGIEKTYLSLDKEELLKSDSVSDTVKLALVKSWDECIADKNNSEKELENAVNDLEEEKKKGG